MTRLPDLPNASVIADQAKWTRYTWFAILGITAFRILMLALGKTELYLDEEQYWLWGQYPDFGYFSKPPLIGWLIGAVTAISGSDTPFWVRFPAPLLHGITAVILAHWARISLQTDGVDASESGFWVALAYLTLPITTVGSFVISTDTVMAPFLAGAIFTYWRLISIPSVTRALITGVLVGLAMLAKYAGVYFFLFALTAAVFSPRFRLSPKYVAVIIVATAIMMTGNIHWNYTHEFATLDHTAGNASWLGGDAVEIEPLRFVEFMIGQAIVLGPVFLFTVLYLYARPRKAATPVLIAFSLPVFLIFGTQSFLADVNANWTFSASLGATTMAVIWLLRRGARRILVGAIALNGLLLLALPIMTLVPEKIILNDKPLLSRYLGRSDMAGQIFAAADKAEVAALLSEDRSILADLFFYSDRNGNTPIFSTPYDGRVRHYFAQTFPLPTTFSGPVLFISRKNLEIKCNTPLIATFDTIGGAYQGRPAPKAYLLASECLPEVTLHD